MSRRKRALSLVEVRVLAAGFAAVGGGVFGFFLDHFGADDRDFVEEHHRDREAELADDGLEDLPPGASSVTVEVDKVTLIPGALAAGTVTFSDGVTGKWVIDQQYRPGFTEISQPGYRPTPADSQAFMQQLSAQLQKRGF